MNDAIDAILRDRFGRDSLLALATVDCGKPAVRTVNALYTDGAFYVVTHALSGKMRHIAADPSVALCGEWFTGRGQAENLGHVLAPENAAVMACLRAAFAAWYGNGHVNESDPGTILLRIRPTQGVLFAQGVRYEW